ncbi:hypothetical protein MMC10_007108 [Thelotrema lepadinum]|nr:hypothetical protein [Thelotrema lepadinum]
MSSFESNATSDTWIGKGSDPSYRPESIALDSRGQHLSDVLNLLKDNERSAQPAPRRLEGPWWAILVVGLVFANFLTSMDNTIVADVQAAVIEDLGDFENFPWISVGFELGAASVQLLWYVHFKIRASCITELSLRGQLYRLLNKKYLFVSAITIFEIGSVMCGSAQSLNAFIVGRVVCGLGGTGVFTGIMNILSALTLPSERAQYLSYPGSMWALGAMYVLAFVTRHALQVQD